jgi:UDP-N-acetylmuramoylalanine--D-glutamate ligase
MKGSIKIEPVDRLPLCALPPSAREARRQVKAGEFQQRHHQPGLDEHWPLPAKKFTRMLGCRWWGRLKFAFHLTDMPMVAITGTNGKSTCTELIAHLFNGCGMKSHPLWQSWRIPERSRRQWTCVTTCSRLRVSSFQLETIRDFRAKASLWLNFAPDHLDRYPDMESYFAAKARVFENVRAEDVAIVRAGESVSSGAAERWTFSAYGEEAGYTYCAGSFYHLGEEIGSASGLKLRGKHNMENVLAALMTGRVFGLEYFDMLKAMESYEPPRHRCELVRTLHDREYINDSKATNLHALEACLRSQERTIVLIAGGKDKELDYTPLRAGLNGQVRAMVLIGEIAEQLKQTFGDLLPCQCATDMADAVRLATEVSQAGDAIILSPGTSSFDMYTGYGQRGEVFREAVNALN